MGVSGRLYGPTYALRAFYSALEYVSRSGEVWCEGARIFMNPISRHFNPRNAQLCLTFAVSFTPQYGDSFIEVLSFLRAFIALGDPAFHDHLGRAAPLWTQQQSLFPIRPHDRSRLFRDYQQVRVLRPQLRLLLVPGKALPAGQCRGGRLPRHQVHRSRDCHRLQRVL